MAQLQTQSVGKFSIMKEQLGQQIICHDMDSVAGES